MKRKVYPVGWLLRRSALLLAWGVPAGAALALPVRSAFHRPAPTVQISGRVTGPDGTGLPGVTVLIKNTTQGTSTNAEGRYTIDAPAGATLVFSSIGYVRREVILGSSTSVDVRLDEDRQALNEVVVVGYGTQERQDVTGSVASVSGRELATQPVADPTQALQGRAAGVTVTSNGGAPGGAGGTAVRIRGLTSAGYNAPLYVVDGFPLPPDGAESQLNSINPNDIESLDVLKDASATAIYGVRAANGVVIITTKRGKAGTSNISLDGYRGVQQVWRKLDLLNAEQYAVINNEGRLAQGTPLNPKLADPTSLGQGTDWQSAVFRPRAQIQNYTLSASGGSETGRFAISAGYFQQDGTLNGSRFERYTVRANGDVNLSKYVKVGSSLAFAHQEDRQLDTGNSEFGVLSNVLQTPPTIPVYRPDGSYYEPTASADNFVEPNPVLQSQIADSHFTRNRLTGTLYLEVSPVKGLRLRTNVGGDFIFDNYDAFTPSLGPNSPRNSVATAFSYNNYTPSYLIENTATYDHTFGGDKHHLTLLAGQSAQQFRYSILGAGRVGYSGGNDLRGLSNGDVNTNTSNYGSGVAVPEDRLASYFGRVNYEFAGRYLLTATGRFDGSSAFALGYKFGFFPAASVGWRISEEAFLKGNSTVSNLKLRFGYGKVGNQNNAGRFAYLATINTGIDYILGTGNQAVVKGAAPTRAQNTALRWEDNLQADIGVDLGLFGNRLELTVDVYNRRSPNLLSNVPPYNVTGTYEAVPTNAIQAYNRGLDLAINSRNIVSSGGFNWTTALTFSTFQNRITALNVAVPFNGIVNRTGDPITRSDAGQPFGAFYGYIADGLFQTQADVDSHAAQVRGSNPGYSTAPGDIRFRDVNGDGKITADDRTYIGSPIPKFTYGLNNTFSFKGFDVNAFIQGSQGNQIYNLNRFYTEGGLYGNGNSSTRVLGRWTGAGTSYDVPRAIAGDPNQNLRVSSYYIEDGSYLRLKVLTLGYNFSKSVLSKFKSTTLRVYVTSQNLVTLTKYSGFDPEVGVAGVDRGVYPQARTFLVGANIGF